CAARNPAESLAARASVTAGLAKEVDAVNQMAAVMQAATAAGAGSRYRAQPQITMRRQNVATYSLHSCPGSLLGLPEAKNSGAPNIRCVTATPPNAPAVCAAR